MAKLAGTCTHPLHPPPGYHGAAVLLRVKAHPSPSALHPFSPCQESHFISYPLLSLQSHIIHLSAGSFPLAFTHFSLCHLISKRNSGRISRGLEGKGEKSWYACITVPGQGCTALSLHKGLGKASGVSIQPIPHYPPHVPWRKGPYGLGVASQTSVTQLAV